MQSNHKPIQRYRGRRPEYRMLFVLVEKRSDEKLRDVGNTPGIHNTGSEVMTKTVISKQTLGAEAALTWSPPEDWMTRLTPPYNETTNHV